MGLHCICTINDHQEFFLYFLTLLGATFKLVRPHDIYLIVELIFENSQFGFKVLRFSTR